MNWEYRKKVDEVLKLHKLWVEGKGGQQADLRDIDLFDIDMFEYDLTYDNLMMAKGGAMAVARTVICPQGEIIGWKKLRNSKLAKLIIPAEAERSNATGRMCRAEYAFVENIFNIYGRNGDDPLIEVPCGTSMYDSNFVYMVGKIVHPGKWDDNRWNEVSNGIHFFITREEAIGYDY